MNTRALDTALSLGLSVLGILIAFTGTAAADLVQVPEPMSAMVFGTGLVGAAVIRRRKPK